MRPSTELFINLIVGKKFLLTNIVLVWMHEVTTQLVAIYVFIDKTEKNMVNEWFFGKKLVCKMWRFVSMRRRI